MSLSVVRLMKQLDGPDPLDRVEALEGLEQFANKSKVVVARVIGALQDSHPWVRAKALDVVPKVEPPLMEAVPLLVRALQDPVDDVKIAAATAIRWMRPQDHKAVKALIFALGEIGTCSAAVQALAAIGPMAKPAVPRLIAILKQGRFPVRRRGRTRRPNCDEEPRLDQCEENWNLLVRDEVAAALGEIGPAAQRAVPALLEMLNDLDFFENAQAAHASAKSAGQENMLPPGCLRVTLALALWQIAQHDLARPALIAALSDPEADVRLSAVDALYTIGLPASLAAPNLILALDDAECHVRGHAATTLGALGPVAIPAIPRLIQALGDNHEHVRIRVLEALEELGALAKSAAPKLVESLAHSSSLECVREATALWSITRDEAAIVALGRCFEEGDRETRRAVMKALVDIGPAAAPVLPKMLDAAQDPNEDDDFCLEIVRAALSIRAAIAYPHGMGSGDHNFAPRM